MKNISSLLGRFFKSVGRDILSREIILEVIKSETRIGLTPDDIGLKEGVLEIRTTSLKQNEIRLKEKTILEILKERDVLVTRIFYK